MRKEKIKKNPKKIADFDSVLGNKKNKEEP